jgi:hypothetical protein
MATQKYHHGDFTETIEKSFFYFRFIKMSEKKVVLVTGGTGLVGKGIEFIATGAEKCADEEWHFLSSKDGDLSYVSNRSTIHVYKVQYRKGHTVIVVMSRRVMGIKNFNSCR